MAKRLANKRRISVSNTAVLGRKQFSSHQHKITELQKRLEDNSYINFAINKIAQEITHFLVK